MKRSNWAVLCGKIRDLKAFYRVLDLLIGFREEGLLEGIVLSTWLNELEAIDQLNKFLKEKQVQVVETLEPQNISFGYILHQKKSLIAGLTLCPENSYVLKIRTDKVDLVDTNIPSHEREKRICLLKKVMRGNIPSKPRNKNFPSIFKDKVFIRLPRLDYFFFIADIYFYGHKKDISKLTSLDMTLNSLYGRISASAEVNFFSAPFYSHFPIIAEYFAFAVPCPRRKRMEEKGGFTKRGDMTPFERKAVFSYELGKTFFLRAMATYLCILNQYFYVGDAMDLEGTSKYDLMKVLKRGIRGGLEVSVDGAMDNRVIKSDAFIERLLSRDWLETPFLSRFQKVVTEVSDFSFHQKRKDILFNSTYEGLTYQKELQTLLGLSIPSFQVDWGRDKEEQSFPLKHYLFPDN